MVSKLSLSMWLLETDKPATPDPVFFLHHTNIDRLWWTWQGAQPGRVYQYNGPKSSSILSAAELDDVLKMKGLGKDIRVREIMSTESGMLCYGY